MNSAELKELLNKEFITVPEVMRVLELSANTIIRKIQSGQLEGVNINPGAKGVWRVRSSSVKRLLGIEDQVTVQ